MNMKTRHRIHFSDARSLHSVPTGSVHLIVTSPPYPMIEMWDDIFARQDPSIGGALDEGSGRIAFQRMHDVLDRIWRELDRVLVSGGIACINIGDATRTIGGNFALYPNHARILTGLLELGLTPLPAILWRKQTNAPNKFMGSGMMPPGAYVTLEHEFILVVRKGGKRPFGSETEKENRRRSAFFWEERNHWFSDVWVDLKGIAQHLAQPDARGRSGAFPFELAYRLVNMFSVKGDTVLDPFLGTGTTMLAAMASARNSVGFELDANLAAVIDDQAERIVPLANARIDERLRAHVEFVRARYESKGRFGYPNRHYGFPVVTRQEVELVLDRLVSVERRGEPEFEVEYDGEAQRVQLDWRWFFESEPASSRRSKTRKTRGAAGGGVVQTDLLS